MCTVTFPTSHIHNQSVQLRAVDIALTFFLEQGLEVAV